MDRLQLTDIELQTHIGVPDEERSQPQTILVTVNLGHDASGIAAKDDPSAGMDYQRLVDGIRDLEKTERKTIERLAEDIAAYILKMTGTTDVTVTVRKHPPIEGVREAAVTISRYRIVQPPRGERTLIA